MAESSSTNLITKITPKEELWRILMAQIIQCLGGKTGDHDLISNKDAIILYCLANRALKPNQLEGPPFTDHMKAIFNIDVHVDFQAPKTSLQTEKNKETQSSSAKDKIPSHPSPSTLVVGEMHKEAQQAAGGPTYLGATSEEGAYPQLSSGCDALADSIAEADPGKCKPNDSIPSQQDKTKSGGDGLKTAHTDLGTNEESRSDEISKKIKLEDLSDLMKDTRSAFFTPDSLQDEPIIISDESEDVETKKDEDTLATSHDVPNDTSITHPLSPKSAQIQELMAQVYLLQSQKDKNDGNCDFWGLNDITNKNWRPLLPLSPGFMSQVAELKTLKRELPVESLDLPSQISPVQAKLQTLDTLPSLLNKVANTLTRFASIMKNASHTATSKGVPSAGPYQLLQSDWEDGTTEVIPNVKVSDLHLAEWKKVLRRLGSIFTSVYAANQKLKKAYAKSFIQLAGQRKPEGQWTGDERKAANLDQRLKNLIMSVLLDDQMNSIINCLTTKSTWDDLIFLKNTNHVKDYELASLFGKPKYEENLIDSIYETEKNKSLVSATPLSTAFFSTSIVQDFQDSLDDKEDTRSSHEYLNDLEEEYQARALLAKSKRFFKKGTQRFSSAKATDQTECHKCGKKGHFAIDCWSKTLVPSYQSPFQPKPLSSSQHKPELRSTMDFKAKYNKIKAKLALLSSNASASTSSSGKNKSLIDKTYEWDEEEVSSDENEAIEVKALMALANEERVYASKESASNGEWVKSSI
ncbi:retrovirus-related pol polyprotein from transposon TNT 1-94 [Tanacetum coccineum]